MDVTLTMLGAAATGSSFSFSIDRLMLFLGRLHPLMVHFPIALLLTALLFEIGATMRRTPRRSRMALQCLAIGAVAAGLAAWFGWISAEQEPYGPSMSRLIFLHRWAGVATGAVAGISLVAGLLAPDGRSTALLRVYRGALLVCGGLIAFGGYLGGEIVHGRNHLIEAFLEEPPRDTTVESTTGAPGTIEDPGPTDGAVPVSFERQIAPILDAHCVHCHGERRQRGRLRLDDPALLVGGDREPPLVVPGDPGASELLRRITLPADDPDLMPADDDPLPAATVELIRRWIAGGATVAATTPVASTSPPREPRTEDPATDAPRVEPPTAAPQRPETVEPTPTPVPVPVPDPPDAFGIALTPAERGVRDEAIATLRERGAAAGPVSLDSAAVEVNLSLVAPRATDDDLALLEGLEPTLVWLDLARSPITDAGVARLADFTQLRRLRLDNTPVTDAALGHLAGLGRLEVLNLHATSVSDEGVLRLAALPALQRVYLWATAVSEDGAEALRTARPGLVVELGAPALRRPVPEASVAAFRERILPIVEESCVHCHGADRQRAGLRLDEIDFVLRGGNDGPVVTPGDAAASELLRRLMLPAGDPELMPADGDPLADEQVTAVAEWIDALPR